MIVCLDAGHGGHDPGAIGAELADGLRPMEKDYTLAQMLIAWSFLRSAGHEVVATRQDDRFVRLRDRARIANDAGAECFISIHWNSSRSPKPDGTIVMHHTRSTGGRALAEVLLDQVGPLDGEVMERNEKLWAVPDGGEGRWGDAVPTVIGRTNMPAVILEVEFGSNPEEVLRMLDPVYQVNVGKGITAAVEQFAASVGA